MNFPTSTFLLASLLAISGHAENSVRNADALCIASIVIEKPHDEIPAYLRYNNLHESAVDSDGLCMSYTSSANETITIYRDSLPANITPTRVEILTNASGSEISEKLSMCGFIKADDGNKRKKRGDTAYVKRTKYHPSRIMCVVSQGSPARITFTKVRGEI